MCFIPRFFKLMLIFSMICAQANLLAMRGHGRQDPLVGLRYRTAFDQKKIHQDFADCMEQWGCARNVFGEVRPEPGPVVVDIAYDPAHRDRQQFGRRTFIVPVEHECMVVQEHVQPYKSREQAYQEECLKKLISARRWAIGEPIQDFIITGCTLGTCTYALQRIMNRVGDNTSREATGFGYLNLLFNLAFRCEDAIRSCVHLVRPPEQRLDNLEELFAKNMCFIPRQLWEKIIEEFMAARTNQMSQDAHISNLEFAVDLTIYKPLKPLTIAGGRSLEEAIEEICTRIEHFFKGSYQVPQDYLTEDIVNIQESVRNFLRSLANNILENNPIKPLYLKGSHGIGKSYFVADNLRQWIEELFPGSVRFEQAPYLESANELQGSSGRDHGIMLDIVRNQCKENKRGSLVFMDEATWLNNPGMVDAAKVVFNGSQSRISTKYFGDAIDILVPPMLIIVASNEPIKDEHLANRFRIIECPKPTVDALIDYAWHKAEQAESLRSFAVTRPDVQDFINPSPLQCLTKGKKAIDNFRDADKIVTHLLASKSHKPLIEEVF